MEHCWKNVVRLRFSRTNKVETKDSDKYWKRYLC